MDTKSLPVNRKDSIAVARLLDQLTESLELEVIGGFQGVGRPVFISDINRPGLALSGYLEYFANDRIQILGNTEIHFMEKLSTSELQHRLEAMFAFEIPAFVLSRLSLIHISEPTRLLSSSYAVFCLKKKTTKPSAKKRAR